MVISGHKDALIGILQQKYGYEKDKAEEEYKLFLDKQNK
jgi:uncharacterized protein YjbJ (UPF0337 family)